MAINERLIDTEVAAAGNGGGGTGNQEEGLILHLDANDVDSYDGDGAEWVDITDHEYTPATNVSEHFNTIIWGGDASTDRDITGVGFAPDLVWIKRYAPNYGGLRDHRLFDTLRGAGKVIYSSGTYREATPTNELNGFLPDGFNIGNSDAVNANVYGLEKYVAWCFKAGGAPSGSDKVSIDGTSYATMSAAELTDGTEPIDKLSVNTKLGFSIVKYTAPALTGDTVAHGLGESPEMIILKSTSVVRNWNVFHKDVGLSKNLHLNTTDSADTGEYWTANPSTFSIQDYSSSSDWIAYCFASKRGVSKVGSFIGTGAAGNKIYTGFEPAFILTKRTSTSGASWSIIDNKRSTDSDKNDYLAANTTGYELTSSSGVTFNRDGFTLNGGSFNTSSQTHIYYAVAKNTNETSLIPDTDLELHLDLGDSSCYSGSGTTVSDLSSNSHTVTTLAGVQEEDFDKEVGGFLTVKENSNEGLTISDHADFDHTNGATYEGWVYLDPLGTDEETFLWRGPSASGAGLRIYWHASYGWFPRDFNASGSEIIDQNNIKTGSSGFGRGKWYHLALTLSSASAATYTFYVDGNTIGSYTASGGGQNSLSYDISLGKYVGGSVSDLHGKIAQFRLYSSALTQDQIRQNYNFTKPSYPNGNDGTISGATWNSSGYFDFDGINDSIDLTSSSPFGTSTTQSDTLKSITGWVKLDAGTRAILYTVSSTSSSNNYFSCQIRDTSVFVSGRNSTSSNSFTDTFTTSTDTNWHHYVFQIDGSERQIYIDGVKKTLSQDNRGTATNSSWVSYASYTVSAKHKIQLAREVSSYYGFGKISKVKMYDKALTQAEITALHNEGQ